MLIDTHCHLDFERFDTDRKEVLERMLKVGVRRVIVPAISPQNWQTVLDLAETYEPVYAAVGVHPNSSEDWQDSWLDTLLQLAQHPKVVAIGEIGLDYYWDKSPKPIQHHAFRLQLALAAELALPAIIHNREADEDMIMMLTQSPLAGKSEVGVLHSFASDWAVAQEVLNLGFYIGFTGPVTYKNAEMVRSVASKVPADRLLVETDAPFLTPHPYRGKRNEPAYVQYVAERLASLRQVSFESFAQEISQNSQRLFGNLGLK